MDPETQAHIEANRRAAMTKEDLAGFGADTATDIDPGSDEWQALSPGMRYAEGRRRREREKLEKALDRTVPIVEVEVTEATVWDPTEQTWVEKWSGTVFRFETSCLGCDRPMNLDSIEAPSVYAREVALGALRNGPRGTFRCDDCIQKAEFAEAQRDIAHKLGERVGTSELPKHMRGMYFNEMLPEGGRRYVVNQVREWAATPEPGAMCLWGSKGAGKTRLAATACWARLQRYHVRWVSLPVLLARLSAAFSDDGRREAISVLSGKGPLILDDVARDDIKISDWAKTQLFTAVDTRIQAGAPLLITTNIAPNRLEPIIGGSTMSRIAGMDVYELPGTDQRIELGVGDDVQQKREKEAEKYGLRDPEEEPNA